ncbi:MAG: hypothetical protein ACYCXA_00450 [Actinomycetes bacterium]
MLAAHRARQDTERRQAGSAWVQTGLVVPTSIGTSADQHSCRRTVHTLTEHLGHANPTVTLAVYRHRLRDPKAVVGIMTNLFVDAIDPHDFE